MKHTFLILGIFLLTITTTGCSFSNQTPEPITDNQIENHDMSDQALNMEGIRVYNLDTNTSTLAWSAKRIASAPHTGTVGIQSGSITFKDNIFTEGGFTMDMTTIAEDENAEALVRHISNEDFFNVERFPESQIEIKSLEQIEGDTYHVIADLIIKEITNEVEFDAKIDMNQEQLTADANFDIDRTKWDITFDSGSIFKELGDKAIRDQIEYTIHLELTTEK
jgi:polyisoprenoid-binding protein YceI